MFQTIQNLNAQVYNFHSKAGKSQILSPSCKNNSELVQYHFVSLLRPILQILQ